MYRRLLHLSCLVLALGSMTPAQAASLDQQRTWYDQAQRALAKGDAGPYYRHRAELQRYPLEPYLAYTELNSRLKQASNAQVSKFLIEHGDLPQAGTLKRNWLKLLAARSDWKAFLDHYDPTLNDTELDCLYGQYQLTHGQREAGQATAERLWLVGKSQPESCDALFTLWAKQGQPSEGLRWQRALLAAEARNLGLTSYLVKGLGTLRREGALLLDVINNPELLRQRGRFSSTSTAMTDVVGLGLRRLARQNADLALELLDDYAARLRFSAEEKVAIAREIGLTLARRFDARALKVMAEYDPELRDDTVSEWRARLLLRLGRWDEAHQLTSRLRGDLASSSRWRYWNARSLQLAQPGNRDAMDLYRLVAGERDFYGFLAADRIKSPYNLNHQPLSIDPKTLHSVRSTAGIRRALELHARGHYVDARREWYHISRVFSREELIAQAKLAHDLDWHFPAIRTLSQARHWDDLDVRFPMPYRSSLTSAAKSRGLHSSWVYAITRQESAFMDDARSHAGAIGLMQLMPATARETARRFGISLNSTYQVLKPETNIQLGTAYLSQVSAQFDGNRILASAAYNAGPTRVRQWLRGADHLEFDVWVENIPFDETRQYVQNVLTYSVIYGQKLNAPQRLVERHERSLQWQRTAGRSVE
ncbi:transglycosylase SLT domain-containing protein [Pseudomonas sp. B392_1p]|uniref:transglycosylase SLT domain-containing protein n=1 Tax=Pseudomonas sp. B392_1p TaxID=3457507 RepID=UPI003FD4E42F